MFWVRVLVSVSLGAQALNQNVINSDKKNLFFTLQIYLVADNLNIKFMPILQRF